MASALMAMVLSRPTSPSLPRATASPFPPATTDASPPTQSAATTPPHKPGPSQVVTPPPATASPFLPSTTQQLKPLPTALKSRPAMASPSTTAVSSRSTPVATTSSSTPTVHSALSKQLSLQLIKRSPSPQQVDLIRPTTTPPITPLGSTSLITRSTPSNARATATTPFATDQEPTPLA